MSLFHLKKFVAGNEDFADAHEPLNDGVKDVPNAQTVAASTKTGDVGTDTNSQGPAKVIPEKEDTDDATEKQFDTVKESAEKGGSETAPAKPAGEPSESKPAPTETAKPAESTKDTTTDSSDGATKPPPFVKKDDAEESEAKADEPKLEHDTAEATDEEIKKTENATKSLEKYSVNAGRFDIIGYPRRDQERLHNTIGFINRRAGKSGNVTKLSLECISEAVTTGKARVEALRKQAEIHAARKVSAENYGIVVDQAVAQGTIVVPEPTAHGNAPLDPLVAEHITEVETDILDLPEIVEIGRIQEAVDTLHGAQVAIEQHLTILRSNKRISKQAAAVLQAGLEHIDQLCGLKVRATGMEGYLTTPRAAVEDANVNEKSLTDRAREIGAKILKWLQEMAQKATIYWEKYKNNLTTLETEIDKAQELVKGLNGEPSQTEVIIKNPPALMFMEGEFVGDHVTKEELQGITESSKFIKAYRTNVINPLIVALKNGSGYEEIDEIVQVGKLDDGFSKYLYLPGGNVVKYTKSTFTMNVDRDPQVEQPQEFTLPIDGASTYTKTLNDLKKLAQGIAKDDVIALYKKANEDLTKAIIESRKTGGASEEDFQKIQSYITQNVFSFMSTDGYYNLMGLFAKLIRVRISVIQSVAKAWA